jgi:NADH/NAD ratio-sensing transcriptional regulator Rex
MKELFFINEEIKQYKYVVIYGAGGAGQNLLLKLWQLNIKVDCFADYNPNICGTKLLNIPIVHINNLPQNYKKDAAVIVCGTYAFEVKPELEKMGYSNLFVDYGNDVRVLHIEKD